MNNQGSKAAQTENEKSPQSNHKHKEICDLNERSQDCISENIQWNMRIYRQAIYCTQKNKLMNKTSILPKRLKLSEKTKQEL